MAIHRKDDARDDEEDMRAEKVAILKRERDQLRNQVINYNARPGDRLLRWRNDRALPEAAIVTATWPNGFEAKFRRGNVERIPYEQARRIGFRFVEERTGKRI